MHPAILPTEMKQIVAVDSTPLPPSVITEKTLAFRMDSRTLWTKYALGLVNYAVSDVANLPNTSSVQQRIVKNANLIGDYFIPYYGIAAGNEITKHLTRMFNIGIDVVAAVKADKDITPYQIDWADCVEQFATFLNGLNPGQWPKIILVEMLDSLTKSWTQNIIARKTGDVIANAESIDDINKLIVTGIANHVNRGYQSLADLLSRGVVAQYPLSFME